MRTARDSRKVTVTDIIIVNGNDGGTIHVYSEPMSGEKWARDDC